VLRREPQTRIDPIDVDDIIGPLRRDQRVRRHYTGEITLQFDRRLPFLAVYRSPLSEASNGDAGTSQLITSEAAFLRMPAQASKRMRPAVEAIAELMIDHFGAFLLLEVWSQAEEHPVYEEHAETGEPLLPAPHFRLLTRDDNPPDSTIDELAGALRKIRIYRRRSAVEIDPRGRPYPVGMKPLIGTNHPRHRDIFQIGLACRPIYRDGESGNVFPLPLRQLRRGLGRALKQAFFRFSLAHTRIRPTHYYALGRRAVVKAVLDVDHHLAHVGSQFDLILQTTPINVEAAWREFKRGGYQHTPIFHYRPVSVETANLKRQLYSIPMWRVEDPTLAHIFRQKRDEIDRKLTMLTDIGTPKFLPGSLQVFGRPTASLVALANELLATIPPRLREGSGKDNWPAWRMADLAQTEVARYRKLLPEFAAKVELRQDLYSGFLSTQGNLLIGHQTKVPDTRAEALLQHEVGTHLVTYYNALKQPLRLLRSGLAGYDRLQEGLAVLAEYFANGLTRVRLRLLAARVLAVEMMCDHASFADVFSALRNTHQLPQRVAYTVTMRVFRGGGLTKDLVYLQGLTEILDYLREGGELEPLLVGKIAAEHVPLVNELRHRQVLRPPPLTPFFMLRDDFQRRLAQIRAGISISQLAAPVSSQPQS